MTSVPDPIITDPEHYDPAEHTTIKLLALALVDADLAHDQATKLAMMPGPHINDLGNVIDVLARVCAALKAINLVEAKVTGQPLDLDGCADLDELARVTLALVVLNESLVRSFDRPTSDVLDAMRLMCMRAVDR